jgi:DNA polymerase III sliding clamp (beta) subunit (PCNA family)
MVLQKQMEHKEQEEKTFKELLDARYPDYHAILKLALHKAKSTLKRLILRKEPIR